jgi:hypothetical protein
MQEAYPPCVEHTPCCIDVQASRTAPPARRLAPSVEGDRHMIRTRRSTRQYAQMWEPRNTRLETDSWRCRSAGDR